MTRYFLELAYKGTRYSGFQVQKNAVTIQSELEKALGILFGEPFALTGSSRTDAGVHAYQNFFHFDTELSLGAGKAYNLNALLPQDITVKGIYPVPSAAHCRFDAVAREYAYFIYRGKDPFLADRGWLYPYPVDDGLLQEAAELLVGQHDFSSFAKRNTQVSNFLCTVESSGWSRENATLVYKIKANRFLRGMVRGLVGTMVKVGRGQVTVPGFRAILEARDSARADFSTPAQGLFLAEVTYPPALKAMLSENGKIN